MPIKSMSLPTGKPRISRQTTTRNRRGAGFRPRRREIRCSVPRLIGWSRLRISCSPIGFLRAEGERPSKTRSHRRVGRYTLPGESARAIAKPSKPLRRSSSPYRIRFGISRRAFPARQCADRPTDRLRQATGPPAVRRRMPISAMPVALEHLCDQFVQQWEQTPMFWADSKRPGRRLSTASAPASEDTITTSRRSVVICTPACRFPGRSPDAARPIRPRSAACPVPRSGCRRTR